ncbi:hypothetical protein DFH29DRAFT_873464 [Suillus ampliporus]|nr:hypothetical protein DFH29DRAFT_873464 [Suillus ampliporus]
MIWATQCDGFRKNLKTARIVESTTSTDRVFVDQNTGRYSVNLVESSARRKILHSMPLLGLVTGELWTGKLYVVAYQTASVTLYLRIPVMLIVEFGDVLVDKWNIPKHIRPLTKEAELRCSDGKKIYRYDDLSQGGYYHLVGNLHDIATPEGFHDHGAVYRLRGGSDAQDFSTKHQIAAIECLHHLHVKGDSQSSSSIDLY